MADNTETASGTGVKVATDKVTYSGDADQNVQLVRFVQVTGAEGSRTVVDVPVGTGVEATALRVTLATDSTGLVSVDDNGASITVDAPVGTPAFVRLSDGAAAITTLPVSLATPGVGTGSLGKQEGEAHTNGNTGVLLLGVRNTSHTAFTGVAQGEYAPINVDAEGCVVVVGNVAHDAPDADPPMKIGHKAVNLGATPTAVAAADRTDWLATRAGVPFVLGGHPNIQSSEYFTSGAITDDNILPAIAAGSAYVITGIMVTCSNANVTSPSVRIGFGTANVPSQGATNADAVAKVILSHPGIAPGSGVVKGNGSGIVGIGASDEELRLTCSTPTTSLCIVVDWFSIAI